MKAFLDDTAQIIGARFDFDQEVNGRSEREKAIGQFVLDKARTVYENAQKIGGAKFLPAFDANLMRIVYLKKYSKNEEGKKKAETGKEGYEKSNSDIMVSENSPVNSCKENAISDEQLLAGEKLVEFGNKLVGEDLVQGTWGNLSIRLDDEYMLVTPSGIDYARLTPKDMVKVRIDDLSYDKEGLKPTSEKGLHAGIYKMRPDVNSVIHTHSTYCSVFAAAEKPLEILSDEGKNVFGNVVRIADYGLPGTDKLAKRTAKAVGNNFGAIMSHHGMVACGKDIEAAFNNCALLEKCAKELLDAK